MEQMDLTIFNLSPIAMWLQDFSGIKKIFDAWTTQGISDIQHYLLEDPNRLIPCLAAIKTLDVNQSTLFLYEAQNLAEIVEKFPQMHTQDTELAHIEFFTALWNKQNNCSISVINYTCKGKRIDVQLRANILSENKGLLGSGPINHRGHFTVSKCTTFCRVFIFAFADCTLG